MMRKLSNLPFILLLTLLTACSAGRYHHANDSTPNRLPNQAELKDAIPRAEQHSRGGNKHYRVRGIDYKVLTHAKDFEEIGTASWYGKKFHGHLTSNGEIYDMYAMSAAHKNLPLPTYAKVTNLTNNKSVIVRVNDRGPFHQERIIDLSYSAAYKLDMLKTGTAKVKISSITNFDIAKPPVPPLHVKMTQPTMQNQLAMPLTRNYIQVFATSKLDVAKATASFIAKNYTQNVSYPKKDGIYRIQIGPIVDSDTIIKLLKKLKQGHYPNAYLRRL